MPGERKPWLTPREQVEHMKQQGIKFELMAEDEAEDYLRNNNTYFRLRSYRTNFARVNRGPRAGQFENLDFAMLKDLAIIDMRFRNEMTLITLDIEHFAKMRLMGALDRQIEAGAEDGYAIVADFIATYEQTDGTNVLKAEIARGRESAYTKGLVGRYEATGLPAWAFIEVITFGRFCHFYKFCASRWCDAVLDGEFYLLQSAKSLRNATSHNNCLLHKLGEPTALHHPQHAVQKAVSNAGVGRNASRKRLGNEFGQQVATALYLHQALAPATMHEKRARGLAGLMRRTAKHPEYYRSSNSPVQGMFDFVGKLVDAWFPTEEPQTAP